MAKYIEMIETTVDLDMVSQHEYMIKPSFDDTLQGLCVTTIKRQPAFIYKCIFYTRIEEFNGCARD